MLRGVGVDQRRNTPLRQQCEGQQQHDDAKQMCQVIAERAEAELIEVDLEG